MRCVCVSPPCVYVTLCVWVCICSLYAVYTERSGQFSHDISNFPYTYTSAKERARTHRSLRDSDMTWEHERFFSLNSFVVRHTQKVIVFVHQVCSFRISFFWHWLKQNQNFYHILEWVECSFECDRVFFTTNILNQSTGIGNLGKVTLGVHLISHCLNSTHFSVDRPMLPLKHFVSLTQACDCVIQIRAPAHHFH